MSSGLFLLVLLALAVGAYLYSRNSFQNTGPLSNIGTQEQSITTRLAEIFKGFGFKQNEKPEEFSEQFQDWSADAEPPQVPVEEFKSWLATRNSEEAQRLTKQIARFANDVNFDLSWVTEEQLDKNPQLKEALSEAVIFYCIANFKASQVALQIKAFVTFQQWQKNPSSPELREFSRLLFTRLIDKGLIAPAPSDLFLASEKERQKHAVAAINQSAKKAPDDFNAILEDVILFLQPNAKQVVQERAAVSV